MSIDNINRGGYDGFRVDIEIYKNYGGAHWAQAKYLVHGLDDVLWTNSIENALAYLKSELERLENNPETPL